MKLVHHHRVGLFAEVTEPSGSVLRQKSISRTFRVPITHMTSHSESEDSLLLASMWYRCGIDRVCSRSVVRPFKLHATRKRVVRSNRATALEKNRRKRLPTV